MALPGAGAPALPLEIPRATAAWDEDELLPPDVRTGAGELADGAGTLATARSVAGVDVLRLLAVAALARRTGGEVGRDEALEPVERPAVAGRARLRWLAAARWEGRVRWLGSFRPGIAGAVAIPETPSLLVAEPGASGAGRGADGSVASPIANAIEKATTMPRETTATSVL